MNKLEEQVKSICEEHASDYDSGMSGFMSDLRQGGCQSGLIGSLTYYSDTVKFHDDFENEIWQLVYDNAQDQGINVMEFITSLNGSDNVGGMDQLKNLLAWFAFEETAFRLFDND
jgi:hypothetical protein